jgi:alcohol dehydrogenase (NADP+)
MNQENNISRKSFIQQSAFCGTGMMLAGANTLFAKEGQGRKALQTVASRGYAARDNSGILSPWSFERRAVGDNDILIDIKFCGICHSDIHQLRGDWGPQQYPQVVR